LALAFSANGDFLRALKRAERLPPRTAYELDVLTSPAPGGTGRPPGARLNVEEAGWTLLGGPQSLGNGQFASPYAVVLASVAQLAPQTITFGSGVLPSFFVWDDRSGALLGAFNAPGRFPGSTFVIPAPATQMVTTQGWPESHCGNCWLVLQH
jgi:hypothetical protein